MREWLEGVCGFALLLLILPSIDAGNGQLALAATVLAFVLVTTAIVGASHLSGQRFGPSRCGPPTDDERRLHGAFRRLSSPNAPGRPQPRAPGAGFRPV